MSQNLFDKNQLKKKLSEYQLSPCQQKKAQEVFYRWQNSVDLSKEKENQQQFLQDFFGEILGYQAVTKAQSPIHSLNQIATGEEIEKRFYAHYKTLRQEVWDDLVKLNSNPKYKSNFYLYKAQKLIDRIIFIRFCRENGALDNDAVLEALNNKIIPGKYQRLKFLFSAMNDGNPEIGIAKFNGGIFAPDCELDELKVSDEIIGKIQILYSYDFGSDLDVNILGHIFEQSISDLENLTGDQEKKRKKDGIFYTPAYITEYIVKEAVGGWLNERKAEIKSDKNFWRSYAQKLASIKCLDPACGSGAFLVQVFDFLQKEWHEVHRHIEFDYDYQKILTNNIFGVDINPASVGITKLSLWLKTAHHRQPLTALDNNIKIGNSLIDDEKVAGYYHEFEGKIIAENIESQGDIFAQAAFKKDSKDIEDKFKKSLAFKWQAEFPQVFDSNSGGFDVAIGNPPYVFARGGNFTKEVKDFYYKRYSLSDYQLNTYLLFIEKANNLLNQAGRLGFIIPNNWLTINSFVSLRKFVLEKTHEPAIINAFGNVFESASVDSCILTYGKSKPHENDSITSLITLGKMIDGKVEKAAYRKQEVAFGDAMVINLADGIDDKKLQLLKKISENSVQLNQLAVVLSGIKAYEIGKGEPKQTEEIKRKRAYHAPEAKDKTYLCYLQGVDVARYSLNWSGEFISYGKWLAAPRKEAKFFEKRILVRQIPSKLPYAINAVFTDQEFVNDINSMIIQDFKAVEPLFVLAILNSKLTSFWFNLTFNKFSRTIFPQFKVNELRQFPIPQTAAEKQNLLAKKAQEMLDLNKEQNELLGNFFKLLAVDLAMKKITKKLEKWYEISEEEFFAEIAKQNKKLALDKKSQWLEFFEKEKQRANALQLKILNTDKEIDWLVYQLYNLNKAEIALIENDLTKF